MIFKGSSKTVVCSTGYLGSGTFGAVFCFDGSCFTKDFLDVFSNDFCCGVSYLNEVLDCLGVSSYEADFWVF